MPWRMDERFKRSIDRVRALSTTLGSALELAKQTLLLDAVEAGKIADIERALSAQRSAGQSIFELCARRGLADSIARMLGGPGHPSHKTLTSKGWEIFPIEDVHPAHVYAVAALIAADELPEALDVEFALQCQALALEAVFQSGQVGIRNAVETIEASTRSDNAKKGGASAKPIDDLVAMRERFMSSHKGSDRGWAASAAVSLKVSETAVRKRWNAWKKRESANQAE